MSLACLLWVGATTGCATGGGGGGGGGAAADETVPSDDGDTPENGDADETSDTPDGTTPPDDGSVPADLLQPADLTYLGAFRLPDRSADAPDAESWEYSGQALAYRADGDPDGEDDGFPGSLFGTGHEVWNYVSEISIPAPSTSRGLEELNTATTLQGFHDVTGGLFDALDFLPRVGLECLSALEDQTSDRLHLAWGAHFQDDPSTTIPSHAWCDLDLSAPSTEGAWWIGDYSVYGVTGYIFALPQEWADRHVGGMTLATGRYRDGGWSGMGPSLIAYAPWLDGDPPDPGTHLQARSLLLYSNTRGDDTADVALEGYQHSDEWEGGAWLTTSDGRTAVVFVGTKGSGYYWYGFTSPEGDGMPCVEQNLTHPGCLDEDGNECPPELSGYCEGQVAESKGWWSSRFDALMLFYDPADLAEVAAGTIEPYEPQPYAVLDIDQHLFLNAKIELTEIGSGDQRKYRVGEMAYDRERSFLYVLERFADGAKPVIHVWGVE
jgi:hypothetical protein